MVKPLREAAKSFAFKHTQLGAPRYPYNAEPIQLATLILELERLKEVDGNVVEIGVARGMTTRFLCQHIVSQRLESTLSYYAIDTYDSFTSDDLNFEIEQRGKSLCDLKAFGYNDYEKWKRHFADFPFVKPIKSDCSVFDYRKICPIKLSFLDVDLYLPTKKTLPALYSSTVNGGVILVDDVQDNSTYDGAYHAYMEFCAEQGIESKIIGNRCGVIHKK